jgi:hypothetical protein
LFASRDTAASINRQAEIDADVVRAVEETSAPTRTPSAEVEVLAASAGAFNFGRRFANYPVAQDRRQQPSSAGDKISHSACSCAGGPGVGPRSGEAAWDRCGIARPVRCRAYAVRRSFCNNWRQPGPDSFLEGSWLPALVQCGLVAAAGLLALVPPERGIMLVLPARPFDPAATIGWVVPAGGLLVAAGPYPGAFVVSGERAALLPEAARHGALLLNGRFTGCGSLKRKF